MRASTILELEILATPLALLRLPAASHVPAWTESARQFLSITRTPSELSIVADASSVPEAIAGERTYRAFMVQGPLPLEAVGILAALAGPLADAGIPIFPIATYDTDYLLIQTKDVSNARQVLVAAGHQVVECSSDAVR